MIDGVERASATSLLRFPRFLLDQYFLPLNCFIV